MFLKKNQRQNFFLFYKTHLYLCRNFNFLKRFGLLRHIVKKKEILKNLYSFSHFFDSWLPHNFTIIILNLSILFFYNLGKFSMSIADFNVKIDVFMERDVRINLITKTFLQKSKIDSQGLNGIIFDFI